MSTNRAQPGSPLVRRPRIARIDRANAGATPASDRRYESALFDQVDWREGEAEYVEIDGSTFERSNLSDARLPSARVADVRIVSCEAVNIDLDNSALQRVEVTRSNLLGAGLGSSSLTDVTFSGCKLMLASFRFSKLRRVSFTDCDLRQATFQGCGFRSTVFSSCDLREAEFSQSTHVGTDLRGSRLEGLRGLEDLRGAVIDTVQLVDLAPVLASSMGLSVVDFPTEG